MNKSELILTILQNGFSMISKERLENLWEQCSKFNTSDFSFVECGVARGGALALMKHAAGPNNSVFGFDSFEGMPPITEKDIDPYNKSDPLSGFGKVGDNLSGGIENVINNLQYLKCTPDNLCLIKGFFNDTLHNPEITNMIQHIGVLRLDADWYESTLTCLETLYNKVVPGGVIIIDDYGHWVGAKRAVDEFRTANNIISPLIQTDYTEVYWIKEGISFNTRNDMLKHFATTINMPRILEIGIFCGEFLDYLTQFGIVDGVDLFEGQICSGDVDGNNVVYCDIGKSFIELQEKYKNNPNVRLFKNNSADFLKSQPDNSYDIIYIDGDHSYEGVKKDIIAAFKKIRSGGYIMGHDYEMNMKKAKNYYDFGVKKAVDEFCSEYNQKIIAKAFDGCVSFCIAVQKE